MREPTAPACYDRRAPEYDWYLGGGDVLFAGDWFVVVVSPR